MDQIYIVVPFHGKYMGMTLGYTVFGDSRLEVTNKLLALTFDRVDTIDSKHSNELSTGKQFAS